MNINYTLGNTLRNESSFSSYRFPAHKPTCEWSGDEVRTYTNYTRPISNLFENDKELRKLSDDTLIGIAGINTNNEIGILNGCKLAVTEYSNDKYFEVTPGSLVYNYKLYQVYPACEACSKQIENALAYVATSEMHVHMDWNRETGKYSGYITDLAGHTFTTEQENYDTGFGLIVALNSAKHETEQIPAFINQYYPLEGFVLLPVWKNLAIGNYLCFGGSLFVRDAVQSGAIIFGQNTSSGGIIDYTNSTIFHINGDSIKAGSIANSKLQNVGIILGSTTCELGNQVNHITGLTSLNGILINNRSGIVDIATPNDSAGIVAQHKYVLAPACTYSETDDYVDIQDAVNPTGKATSEVKLPSAYAVRKYVEDGTYNVKGNNLISGTTKFENTTNWGPVGSSSPLLSVYSTGKVINNSNINANLEYTYEGGRTYTYEHTKTGSLTVSSANGAEVINGGLTVIGDVFAALDVKGMNLQATSARITKENIRPFDESALDIINGTDVNFFTYKADGDKNLHIGIIADDTHEYIATKKHDTLDMVNSIGLLFKAVQELSAENKALKEEIDAIKSRG